MTIRVEKHGEITVVTIDRLAARNAVNTEMAAAMFSASWTSTATRPRRSPC
jgi:enoyl-CoA hydratase/carnithine racemase